MSEVSLYMSLVALTFSVRPTYPWEAQLPAVVLGGSGGLFRGAREIGNLLPNNQRQRRTCYELCHILYPVSAAHTSIRGATKLQDYTNPPPTTRDFQNVCS